MAVSIDQQFIEYIVKSVVGNPDAVKIERRIDEKGVLLELSVDPEDLGRVIGKHGATAQSLRTLLRALGTKNDARYNLKIIDTGDGSHRRPRDEPAASPASDDSHAPVDDSAASASADDTTIPANDSVATNVNHPEDSPTAAEAEKPRADRMTQTRKELAELDDLDV